MKSVRLGNSILPIPQSHTSTRAILINKKNAGVFEGGADGGYGFS
ncbi:hypothetical protein [Paenochrobactrum pullorum]